MYIPKYFALLCLFILASWPVYAQSGYYEEEPKVFNGGLIVGANFSQVDGDTFYGYDKIGINAGGVVYVHFTPAFGASMELIYSQKGSRGELVTASPITGTYVEKYFMNLNYVEVPVTMHLVWSKIDFEAGISYAYLINSSEWVQADVPVIIDPVANRFDNTDLDYIVGIGRKIYRKIYINARFQYSITSIRPTYRVPVGFSYGNDGQFNNLFSLRLVYLY